MSNSISNVGPATSESPIDKALRAFPEAKRYGDGWIVDCPIHDDEYPSLRITEMRDTTVLLRCQVCGKDRTKDILASVGLSIADLFRRAKELAA